MPGHFLKLPAEGSPGLLVQHKPSYSVSKHLCLMVTAFPSSNTWWLHSEFLQDSDTPKHRNSKPQARGWLCISSTGPWTSLIQHGSMPRAGVE